MGQGAKVGATAIIWAFATGMLAICIPLVSLTHGDLLLPQIVLIATCISTVAIWLSTRDRQKIDTDLTESVERLKQQVADLETIASDEEIDLRQKISQLAPKDSQLAPKDNEN